MPKCGVLGLGILKCFNRFSNLASLRLSSNLCLYFSRVVNWTVSGLEILGSSNVPLSPSLGAFLNLHTFSLPLEFFLNWSVRGFKSSR